MLAKLTGNVMILLVMNVELIFIIHTYAQESNQNLFFFLLVSIFKEYLKYYKEK